MVVEAPPVAAAIVAAQAEVDRLVQLACEQFETDSAADRIETLNAVSAVALQHQAAVCRFVEAIEHAPSRTRDNAARELHHSSTTELLQRELGYGKIHADGVVRLAKLLRTREYPALAEAIAQATVSNQQAIVIVRQLDDWRGTCDAGFMRLADEAAVAMAEGTPDNLPFKVDQLAKNMTAWRMRQNPQEAEASAEEQWENRSCSVRRRRDGSIGVSIVVPTTVGGAITQFLDANASPRARFGSREFELDDRTRTQKMADAAITAFTVAAKSRETSTQGGEAPTLTVTVPIDEMRRHAAGFPALATVARTQELVPVAEVSHIVCEGAIQVAATDDHGTVLKLGRTQRLFSKDQRKALNLMYPECATGGCDIPAVWCESHHVSWWSRGGPTDIANGVNLCNYHHHEVHNGNLAIEQDHDRERWRITRAIRR